MDACRQFAEVERWIDGEAAEAAGIERHVAGCAACAKHAAFLRQTRTAVAAVATRHHISDAQFPAFMEGLRVEIERPQRSWRGLWALGSLVSAALVAAIALYSLVKPAPVPVEAKTEVELFSTQIEGATTKVDYSDDGVATIWINVPEGDMW